tara:strand:+ start:1518 stop:1706 length:189 start_codon:yes stop_codon:yes gene_type:complete
MQALVIAYKTMPQMTAKMMIEAFLCVVCIWLFILSNNFLFFYKNSPVCVGRFGSSISYGVPK